MALTAAPVRCVSLLQPIVTIDGHSVIGYEALTRVPGRNIGDVLQAMDPDASRAFDADVAARALWDARRLPPGVRLFLNVTTETLEAVLHGARWPVPDGAPSDRPVVWEIPERRAGTELLLRRGAAGALSDAEVALDDLGEGDSDLCRLAAYPGAWVKLGIGLVRDCDRHPPKAAVIRAVLAIATDLRQRVIAEGVERPEEAATLAALGVPYAQGFLFGRPRRQESLGLVAGRDKAEAAPAEAARDPRPRRVYVAGPISVGDRQAHVAAAIEAAEALWRAGLVPFVPHLACGWDEVHPHPWDDWMHYDQAWLALCDALVRLPGESRGADAEVAWCHAHCMPVFHGVQAAVRALGKTPPAMDEARRSGVAATCHACSGGEE